jgi:hypothetical protein
MRQRSLITLALRTLPVNTLANIQASSGAIDTLHQVAKPPYAFRYLEMRLQRSPAMKTSESVNFQKRGVIRNR